MCYDGGKGGGILKEPEMKITVPKHDAGVPHINEGKFYLGVSVYGSQNKRGNRQLSGNIGRLVYDYLHQIDKV